MDIDSELIGACWNENLYAVKECTEQGANIHTEDDLALRLSANNGYLEIVKYLVEQGADIHAENDYALRWAANNGHLAIVKYLVEHGANIHADDGSALRYAALNRHLKVMNVIRKAAGAKYKCNKCIIRSTCLELCKDFRNGYYCKIC